MSEGTEAPESSGALGQDLRELLLAIARSIEPVRVAQARNALVNAGIEASESTVARRLRDLDAAGLTILIGKQGRVLTSIGADHAVKLRTERERAERIVSATTVHSANTLLDLLRVRRAVEPEAAREAVHRASADDIADLRARQRDYARQVKEGGDLPRDVALAFHRRLTGLAQNPLLRVTLDVTLDPTLDRLEAALDIVLRRHHVHEASVDEHGQILDAMQVGDAELVEERMRAHLSSVVAEVEHFAADDDSRMLDRLLVWSSS